MSVIDASVWVSLLSAGERHHEASRRWVEEQSETGLSIPALALPEVAGDVARRTGSTELGNLALQTMLATPGLAIVPLDLAVAAEAAAMATQYRLRGADAVYVAIARLLTLPLATLDRELQERGAGAVPIVIPG